MERILIAHNSLSYAQALARQLGNRFSIQICTDGALVNDMLDDFAPQILILHTAMPRKDSLCILRQATRRPQVILALTNYLDPRQEQSLMRLGVQQVLLMPTVTTVAVCLCALQAEVHRDDPDRCLSLRCAAHLHILRMPAHLAGFRLLCAALPLLRKDPRQPLGKQLYPAAAKLMDMTDGRAVERSVRNAIETAFALCPPSVWKQYFPPDSKGSPICPSNKRFFTRLLEILQNEDLG